MTTYCAGCETGGAGPHAVNVYVLGRADRLVVKVERFTTDTAARAYVRQLADSPTPYYGQLAR